MPETKTPEHEILEKHISLYFSSHHDKSKWNGEGENGGAEWHGYQPIAEDIFKAMKEYASQQSRATAIGFAEWKDDNYIDYQMTGDLYYHKRDLLKHIDQATVFTLPELYDLYTLSLTNQNKEK